MIGLLWLCAVVCIVAISRRTLGSWRAALEATLGGVAFTAAGAVPIGLAYLFSETTAWCLLPLALGAGWFGQTPLGALNFAVLQWFGVRLAPSWTPSDDDEPRGRWWSSGAPARSTPVRWRLLRWIWPLTGWWSSYRWIARRP